MFCNTIASRTDDGLIRSRIEDDRCVGGLATACCCHSCVAQAWLPNKGTFSTALVSADVLNTELGSERRHDPRARQTRPGHTRSTSTLLASYGIPTWSWYGQPAVLKPSLGPPIMVERPASTQTTEPRPVLTDLRVNIPTSARNRSRSRRPRLRVTDEQHYVKGPATRRGPMSASGSGRQ